MAVPARVAVPLALGVKVTPAGRVPLVRLRVGVGEPLVVTVKLPGLPLVKVVLLALVKVGAAAGTVRVKLWVALGSTPLAAVMVSG